MNSSPSVRAWERVVQRRRERAAREEHRHMGESLGFLMASIIGLGLALLAAVLSTGS
jgi:hypothetical protein